MRSLAEDAGSQRTALINLLLEGYDESDGRITHQLRDAGYLKQRLAFCVLVAKSADPAEMQNPARARRLAAAIKAEIAGLGIRILVDIRDKKFSLSTPSLAVSLDGVHHEPPLLSRLGQSLPRSVTPRLSESAMMILQLPTYLMPIMKQSLP